MALGILGYLGLGALGAFGSGKVMEWEKDNINALGGSPVRGNQPDHDFNKGNDNVSNANEIVNKQTDPTNQNHSGKDSGGGQLDSSGKVSGYSEVSADIEGDPDGGSLLDATNLDDAAIVKGASNAVENYYDPLTDQTFDSHDHYLAYIDQHPFRYAWQQRDTDMTLGWFHPRNWKIFGGASNKKGPAQNVERKWQQENVKYRAKRAKEHKKSLAQKEYDLKRRELRRERFERLSQSLMDLAAQSKDDYFKYEL